MASQSFDGSSPIRGSRSLPHYNLTLTQVQPATAHPFVLQATSDSQGALQRPRPRPRQGQAIRVHRESSEEISVEAEDSEGSFQQLQGSQAGSEHDEVRPKC